MDYQVWHLASDSSKFEGYMKIPLTKAGSNATACMEWLVIYVFNCVVYLCIYLCYSCFFIFFSKKLRFI